MDLLIPILTELSFNSAFQKAYQEVLSDHPNNIGLDFEQMPSTLRQAWQQADFCRAREVVELFSRALDRCSVPEVHFAVHLISGVHYSETGNLDRAITHFRYASAALHICQESRGPRQTAHLEDDSRQTILSSKMAWCYILGKQFDVAREILIEETNFPAVQHQRHRSVLMAVIDSIEGGEVSAETHLWEAEEAYKATNDFAALAAIHLYQARVYLHAGARQQAITCLTSALCWLERENHPYLPYWWHPRITPALLEKAIEVGCYPEEATRILHCYQKALEKIGDNNPQPSTETEEATYPSHHPQRAKHIADVGGINMTEKWRKSKNELARLVEIGFLNEQRLPQLAKKIPHGTKGSQLNPTILAVFGLYAQHISVSEIANRLEIATNTVKAYITKIYNAFELGIRNFSKSTDRRLLLVEKAINEGYLM